MMRHHPLVRHTSRLATLVILVTLLAGCGRSVHLPEPLPVAAIAAYPGNTDPPLLVDAARLSELVGSGSRDLVIIDASSLVTYRAGHIPGAVHAWWQDTMNPNELFYGGVLKPEENDPDPQLARRQFIEDLGVAPESRIVIYDDDRGRWAARFVWTLRFLGYPNAAALDGGLGAWLGAGGDLETRENAPAAIPTPPISPSQGYYITTDELLGMLGDPQIALLDARTDSEARDTIDETIEPGSIPNSIRVPWTDALDGDSGRLKSPGDLRSLFESAGITPDRTVVIYARIGVETAHPWLMLKLLGYPNVLIYDGGWVDWATNPSTPKIDLA
jgi:thiosulfate/3-mercaptopyruvate sulfurtransferase